jgi:hypothetical protein
VGTAKIISLNARPLQASHLCFEADGILADLNAQLGAAVTAFDFGTFYTTLGGTPTVAGQPSRLLYDFLEIQAAAKPSALASLRSEPLKASLNKAINVRQNAYFAKYGNAPAIIAQMNQYFSPSVIGSKPQRLANLAGLSQTQWDQLKTAYVNDGRSGVVKSTKSILTSDTRSSGSSQESGRTDQDNISTLTQLGSLPGLPPAGMPVNVQFTGGDPNSAMSMGFAQTSSGETTGSTGSAHEDETIINTDYGYRVPYLEGAAQYERAQISLIDQQFAQYMQGQNLPNLTQVFQNELNAMDGDVFRLQIAFLNTILMSPISGVVTGLYKNPGEPVRAGEPVVRVENNDTVLLVANLVYRGPIPLGSAVTIETTLFDAPGPNMSLSGSVVAVRGQQADDQWEVIVNCANLKGGNQILPIGYRFDYDDTTITIT